MKRTPQQQAFVDGLVAGDSILLEAVAGSGKTTTLVGGLKEWIPANLGKKALLVAFNKRNVADFEKKLEKTGINSGPIELKTLNGLGHRVWMNHLKGRKINLNSRKTFDIIKEKWSFEEQRRFADLFRVVAWCKIWPMVPPGAINGPQNWQPGFIQDYIEECEYELDIPLDVAVDRVAEVLRESIKQAWNGEIDFDDQLYMPIISRANFYKFDLVVIDEAQDLNGIQHMMLAKSLRTGGQVVAAGDRRQAIYAFRGADAGSMKRLQDTFNLKSYPLTVSFRCPKSVVAEAAKIVPEIEAFAEAPEGEVKWGSIADIGPGSAILSRYNRHLIPVAYSFIKAGWPAKILGGDVGKNLAKLVRAEEAETIDATMDKIKHTCEKEAMRFSLKGNDTKAQQWKEKYEIVEAIKDFSSAQSAEGLAQAILSLFSDEESTITLSTIHKAKGMEWETVGFVAPDQVPSHHAKRAGGVALEQDWNCKYVAITRAQKKLVFIPEANSIVPLKRRTF